MWRHLPAATIALIYLPLHLIASLESQWRNTIKPQELMFVTSQYFELAQ